MNGSRPRYSLDDYMQDKAQRASSPLARGGSSGLRQGMAVTPTGNTSVGTVKPLPVRPPHTVQSPSGSGYSSSSAGGGQNLTGDMVKPDAGAGAVAGGGVLTQSQMTTAYTKQLMENALSNLLAMQNRKFKYDAHSSPLYSIVQKQAEENARLASGRAYAKAKGATGGYGSSYATLAAEEAGRLAMRELDDQQLALYEAARAEFEAENASALDWYNTTKQLYADGALTETASAAAQELQNTWGTDYSEKTQREYLASKGYSEADINAALESQRKLASGTVTDYKAGTITDAVAQSQSFDEAFRQGTLTVEEYDAAKAQNSKVIMDNVNKGMIRIDDVDHAALGISDEEWSGMKDGEKKLAVFDRVGELAKAGVVSSDDFYKLLYNDIKEEFDSEEFKNEKEKNKPEHVMAVASLIDDYHEKGYINDDDYIDLLYNQIVPKMIDNPKVSALFAKVKDYKNHRGKDATISSIRWVEGAGEFPKGLNRDEKELLVKIANRYASTVK